MRKTAIACLMLAAALSFTACGGSSTKETTAPVTTAAETAAETKEAATAAAGGQVVEPVQKDPEVSSTMEDRSYLVSIDPASFKKSGDGYEVSVEFYSYDEFRKKEVEALKAGDVLRLHDGDMPVEKAEITEGDRQNTVSVNGGEENGGCDLIETDTCYRTYGLDDFPDYYSIGTAVLPVSSDCVYFDFSDLNNPRGDVYKANQIKDAFSKQKDMTWGPQAISITVQGGKITEIFRSYTP